MDASGGVVCHHGPATPRGGGGGGCPARARARDGAGAPPRPAAAARRASQRRASLGGPQRRGRIVRKTCRLDGRKSCSGFRPCTRREQAISCYNPVQVHGPCRESKRSEDHVVRLGSMCTIMPRTLRPACTSVYVKYSSKCYVSIAYTVAPPFVVTTDSIHIRRCEAAAIVDVGSPRRGRRVTEAC